MAQPATPSLEVRSAGFVWEKGKGGERTDKEAHSVVGDGAGDGVDDVSWRNGIRQAGTNLR